MKLIVLLFSSLLALSSNASLIIADNFNDNVFTGWVEQEGTANEAGGLLSGSSTSLFTLDGQFSNSIGVNAISNSNVDYVALVLNFTSLTDNLFIKIQDNNGNGLFDRIFFYHGNNGNDALIGTNAFNFSSEVSSSFFQITDNGDGTVSAFIGATGDTFGGSLLNTYSGTGVGLGFLGNSQADNFYIETTSVSEPNSTLILAISLFGLSFFRRISPQLNLDSANKSP